MSTTTVWESGLTCDAEDCGGEFRLGEEIIYWYGQKLHQRCASAAAASRREAAVEESGIKAGLRLLESGARVILNRRQLRELIRGAVECGIEPVRKPDTGRHQWYGRMQGWSAARVQAGLSAAEVTGMWSDFLDVGRMPPLRNCDLRVVMAATEGRLWSSFSNVTVTPSLPAAVPDP